MVLIRAVAAAFFLFCAARPASAVPDSDPIATARRIAALTQLAAQEYRVGVDAAGRVVSQAEVDEARLFLTEARKAALDLPSDRSAAVVAQMDLLLQHVAQVRSPDSLDAGSRRVADYLAGSFGIQLDPLPGRRPSLARGGQLYAERCSTCHGNTGAGDGPQGAGLDPRPADLTSLALLAETSPLDFYRRVTYGVAGTAMPAFEPVLSLDDRWAVAAYATLLRLPAARGNVPSELRSFSATASRTDREIAGALGVTLDSAGAGRVAAVRWFEPTRNAEMAALFGLVRNKVDSAMQLASAGDHAAAAQGALDAYLAFEVVETDVRTRNASLAGELEAAFAAFRGSMRKGAPATERGRELARVRLGLERAQRIAGDALSPVAAFVQSFVLLVREGLEAILIVGALLAFLARSGGGNRRRDVHWGVAAAVVASLVTAVLLETVFQITPVQRETLEGFVMLAATAVLFYVSYWLLSKMELSRWTGFLERQARDAVTQGSALALAAAAFLAVYREGFETILFYKALFLSGGTQSVTLSIVLGMALGTVVLTLVYVGVSRFGVRLPLRPFFAITGVFLYVMAVVFAGRGIAELQEGGIIGTTVLPWAPRVPWLGVYPTVQSLLAQGVLVIAFVVAMAIALKRPRAVTSERTERPRMEEMQSSTSRSLPTA